MERHRLSKYDTGLLIIDVQEKLFPHIERNCEVLGAILKLIKGFQTLKCPILTTEQYPQGLGETVAPLLQCLGEQKDLWKKTTFSACDDAQFRDHFQTFPQTQWVIAGIEAHICVLQTCRDLLNMQKRVIVVNDAISSRSIYDFSTAIAELRDMGCRISSYETILFELIKDSKEPEFKEISKIIR